MFPELLLAGSISPARGMCLFPTVNESVPTLSGAASGLWSWGIWGAWLWLTMKLGNTEPLKASNEANSSFCIHLQANFVIIWGCINVYGVDHLCVLSQGSVFWE